MRKIEPELITGMGYIGDNPGVLYRMGGAGEQTVVTGNPALLEGVKGSRLTALTLHGKSTQGSTTGANILKDNYLSLCKGAIDLFSANGLFTVNANYEKNCEFNLYFSAGSIFADGIKDEATYYIAFRPIGFTPKYNYQLSLKNERDESFSTSANGIVTSVSGADLKKNARIQLYFFNVSESNPVVSGSKFQMIFSKKPDCNYEPYTGGAPSPSPSYPQEIESAGQSGEIGVTVTGTNLLPFEVGQKGDGFEAFADGVQVDVGRNVDIYAVGRSNGNVESGYDEFALMTAGKYYIYSDIQGVNLYAVVWRKGTNVILGYSTGGVAKEIEVMDGDKFRIFLRTEEAFNGKVKAMITRTPMNATSYEPYKPAQKLIIPTPGGLPGIPVSSGGNYTDKDGQQWVADEIDLANGEKVQWIGKLDLKSSSWAKQSRASNAGGFWFSSRIKSASLFGASVKGTISNIGRLGNPYNMVGDYVWALTNGGSSEFRIGFADSTIDSLEKLTNLLNSLPEAYAMYCLAEPIRTPLPPETIAAYKALHTYSPTTTVINDAGAGMSVGYRRK